MLMPSRWSWQHCCSRSGTEPGTDQGLIVGHYDITAGTRALSPARTRSAGSIMAFSCR